MNQIVLANNVHATTREPNSRQRVGVTTKYVRRADDKGGWLGVKPLFPYKYDRVYLCEYTKVIMLRADSEYTAFKVMDGNGEYVGKEVALSNSNVPLYMSDVGPEKSGAIVRVKYSTLQDNVESKIRRLFFRQQWAVATFAGLSAQVTLNSVWNGIYTPIPPGKHKIMAPDYSHAHVSTAAYRAAHPGKVLCTDVWFPIALEGTKVNSTRYLHVGHVSEGCVTFYELLKWNPLYDYLINKRVPNTAGKFIGELIVEL
ncbi:hypothetical protein [Pseudomonas fluorescens]|uniref:hypothetical protein n=1 Tax=Pseudomonas fluorescens TaxID=294 RepID=UPI0009B954D1|nr:hypothetical protein [Pseudomonas fluorescens]